MNPTLHFVKYSDNIRPTIYGFCVLIFSVFGAWEVFVGVKNSQIKGVDKVFERTQLENAKVKKELIKERDKFEKNSKEWNQWNEKAQQIRTISDGTKKTYSDDVKAVIREANRLFGITRFKELTPEMTQHLIINKINRGESAQTIRKMVHALEFFQTHATQTGAFKENQINITNHASNLQLLKDNNVIRRSSDSHRYRATKEESIKVIEEMAKVDPFLADIAKYQLLTGFRVSEAIRQQEKNINVAPDRVKSEKAKGGLTNVIAIDHLNQEEKQFLNDLKNKADEETGRIFERQTKIKDDRYKSDERIRQEVTKLAHECAKNLGIGGAGKTFSSHSFRGAFALERVKFYAKNASVIDQIIADKIKEQPRLKQKYKNFEDRIKNHTKNPKAYEIQPYQKIQWALSTDLNHSRQDIARFYISVEQIKDELKKYK